jgi:hypothetical protein
MSGSCEHGTEPPGLMKGGKFVDQLREYLLLSHNYDTFSYE